MWSGKTMISLPNCLPNPNSEGAWFEKQAVLGSASVFAGLVPLINGENLTDACCWACEQSVCLLVPRRDWQLQDGQEMCIIGGAPQLGNWQLDQVSDI